jgi:hypothetical protein
MNVGDGLENRVSFSLCLLNNIPFKTNCEYNDDVSQELSPLHYITLECQGATRPLF